MKTPSIAQALNFPCRTPDLNNLDFHLVHPLSHMRIVMPLRHYRLYVMLQIDAGIHAMFGADARRFK